MSNNNKTRSIEVPILARVEGEGALSIQIKGQTIQSLQLKIYEPPRFFEKLLEGRHYDEVLDFVARICGICPVAYQMSAAQAIESCFEVTITPWIREMRRLFYCGEWLESHSLHVHFLAAPDFLGFNSAPEMAKHHPEVLRRGLRLQALGNALVTLLGGRSVHPVGACIGGFYKAPSQAKVQEALTQVNTCIEDCELLIEWLGTLSLPDNTHDFTCVSLSHPNEYPMNEGLIVSDKELCISIDAFDEYFKEEQVPYSTALHCLLQGTPYLVGPLARINLNHEKLPAPVLRCLAQAGFHFPSFYMGLSIVARAAEIYQSVLEAQRILQAYTVPSHSRVTLKPRAGVGMGCTEAPRGMLWHRFETDEAGLVNTSRIVPPTSQNQARIEADLRISLMKWGLDQPNDALRAYSEMLIRNYDPCISCSTHFLTLDVARR